MLKATDTGYQDETNPIILHLSDRNFTNYTFFFFVLLLSWSDSEFCNYSKGRTNCYPVQAHKGCDAVSQA